MKRRRLLLLFAIAGGCLSAAQPITVPALGPRFKQTRERIDAIFKYRTGEDSVPDPKLNLFRTATAPATAPEIPDVRKNEPVDSDEVILQQTVASLRRSNMKRGDQLLLLINQKTYQEGSIVPTRYKDRPVLLEIKAVSENSVTFGYNQAQLTVPL